MVLNFIFSIRKIESSELTIYELKCPHAQTILRFDGQKIIIKIADMYMNRQCGVCGHMNNDREDDFLKVRSYISTPFYMYISCKKDIHIMKKIIFSTTILKLNRHKTSNSRTCTVLVMNVTHR